MVGRDGIVDLTSIGTYHPGGIVLCVSIDFCDHYCGVDLWFVCGTVEVCTYDPLHRSVAPRLLPIN